MILALLLGCLEPFPVGREDLVDLRIAGMARLPSGELDALVWDGTASYSETAPLRTWGGDAECAETCMLAEGGTAELQVENAAGEAESGTLTVEPGAWVPDSMSIERLDQGDGTWRLRLYAPEFVSTRWMSPEGELEQDEQHGVIYTPGESAAVQSVVALTFDGKGGNTWTVFDVAVDVPGPFLAARGRLLEAPGLESGTGRWIGTLVERDTPAGFGFDSLMAADGESEPGCGVDSVGLWQPDSLLTRDCGRSEVLGLNVVVDGEVVP